MKNKIHVIGKVFNSVRLEQQDENNNCLLYWYVRCVARRKTKLICYTEMDNKITITFANIKDAEKTKQIIKEAFYK